MPPFLRSAVCEMIKTIVRVAAFAVAAIAPVNGQELASETADTQPAFSSQQPLLTAIEAWLAFQFDLPGVERHPRIELADPARMAALRGGGLEASSQGDSWRCIPMRRKRSTCPKAGPGRRRRSCRFSCTS
jgi:hypothetical protein